MNAANLAISTEQQPGGIPAGWVCADMLGKSPRHARRLFDELRPLGAARAHGRLRIFDANHPQVRKLLAATHADESYEDLSPYTQKQVESAQHWVRIIKAEKGEVPRRMIERGCDRMAALEWFCKVRCPELGFGAISVGTLRRRSAAYDKAGTRKLVSQIDTRGGKTGNVLTCDPDAWSHFCGLFLTPNKLRIKLCHELTAHAAQAHGWAWPSLRTIQRKATEEIPELTRVLYREGERAFKSKCLPRIRRSYEDLPALDTWCADEHTLDLYASTADGRGALKRCRPILTAWLDVRSRYFVGWHIGARGNSDTIVAGWKMGVAAFGPPLDVICDNGEDYKAAAGRSRKWHSFDAKRLTGIYSELGCTVHWATPYEPQAKMIESHFRHVCERFAKLFDSYCGNKPENRPDGAADIPVWKLPTVAEVAAAFGKFLEAHHAKPQSGDGMHGLAPVQAIEQFRGDSVRQRPTSAMLEFLCAKIVGPVKVTRDGVRWLGVHYGQGCDELLRRMGEQVLLRVHPDTAHHVDVCDLDGRPIVRATNDRLTGATQDDIRTAASRRKRARRLAREYVADAPAALKRSNVAAILDAQHNRNRSQQTPTPPAEPPSAVRIVRPDLADAVAGMPVDRGSSPDRIAARRRSKPVDLAALNEALGLGKALERPEQSARARVNVDAILASGFRDEAVNPDEAYADNGSAADAFTMLGNAVHERRRA